MEKKTEKRGRKKNNIRKGRGRGNLTDLKKERKLKLKCPQQRRTLKQNKGPCEQTKCLTA